MIDSVIEKIDENPIIAAVRNDTELDAALESPVTTIFLLHADIFNIKSLVDRIKDSGKIVMVHMDLLEGLGRDQRAIDYIHQTIKPHGIITTKSSNVKYAKEIGLFSIQRFFLVDSQSFELTIKTALSIQPDMIEIMPGILPTVLERICSRLNIPVIAGGLIETKDEIMEALRLGAHGVSTGKKELWAL
jgi:glycerol uptake operon antiterminator